MSDMDSFSLYNQVYQQILHAIQTGEYPENAPLPPERYLCEKYHVSRTTIRQALARLKEAEVIYSVQGHGTFVKPQVFVQPLAEFYSFTDTLKNDNIIIRNEIVSYDIVDGDEYLSRKTGYKKGTRFHRLGRLRSAKEYPLMLETTFLPSSRFVRLDLDALSKGSLYEYLRTTYNFQIDRARETLRPVMPTPEENELLQMPPSVPCILLERFCYEHEILIEYTKSIVRGDKYIFRAELGVS